MEYGYDPKERNRAARATYAVEIVNARTGEVAERRLAFGANPTRSAIRRAARHADATPEELRRTLINDARGLDTWTIELRSGFFIRVTRQ